ncbi:MULTISPECIES: DNA-3-methyladenine glycosylase I [Gammaproteobacteria]|uniref:DNA-3-methyladenine glycosylase I n=1 Tax=Gammaproteobacteria TaxID=1236 RepID=UPI000DCFBEFA|nr:MULTISPECIES: DNA-3-methyladenine glycosylase I [Gammaproteobacteria]RTE85736.1 DNA-3-methyladenine glycosylase I [Aliidiomarina sp. B3213]TCZ90262.1 DNA-3-methyladenine glycosylase I [Lysobacter sp. N42]
MKFSDFYQRALERKGSEEAISQRLPKLATPDQISAISDDRILSDMTRCIFRAGFVWRIIDQKWPGFEEAFKGFIPRYWQQVPPEIIEELGRDTRIVRNLQKIATVPQNAFMIMEVVESHGSFGAFLANWPSHDQAGLLKWLKKNGSRLGGATSQFFLRMQGWDGFITSPDVITALENHRLIDANPASQTGLKQIQAVFNQWHEESGLPYAHLSRILSMTLDARA